MRLPLLSALTVLAVSSACGPALQYPTASRQSVEQEEHLAKETFLRQYRERHDRVVRVYDVLRTANADLCPGRLAGP
jgi:hypothetical protein